MNSPRIALVECFLSGERGEVSLAGCTYCICMYYGITDQLYKRVWAWGFCVNNYCKVS